MRALAQQSIYDGEVIELLDSSDDDENDKSKTKATVEDEPINNNIQDSKTSEGCEFTKDQYNSHYNCLKSLDESRNNNIGDSKGKIDVKSLMRTW